MPTLTVYVVAQNAAGMIERVIRSVDWADVVVVDLQSRDETAAVAARLGATVQRWEGAVPPIVEMVRHRLVDAGGSDFFLFVDQDEVHVDTRDAIEQHIASGSTEPLAFRFRHFVMGHEVASFPTATRLFHRTNRLPAGIHEPTPAQVAETGHIDHFPITSAWQWAKKWRRYASYEADALVGADWTLAVGRDLIKGPLTQVRQTFSEHRGSRAFGLTWGLHAALWVFLRPLTATWRRRSVKIRLGGLRERPWGWGERVPDGYLN